MSRRFTVGMRSSTRQDWRTPASLFTALDREFGFTLDVASQGDNALSESFFDERSDGLGQSWQGHVVYLNPPYRYVSAWMAKAHQESIVGATVVCLVPGRVDTQWWSAEVVPYADEIRFIRGRLRFDDRGVNAPFPSVVVIYRTERIGTLRVSTINPDGTPFRVGAHNLVLI